MPRIETNGIHLYYEVQGTGTPLLFIHGLGSSTEDWEPQVREFSRSHRVLTCDLRGHGRSDKPPGPYSIPMFAADVAELLQALRCVPAHIVGLSLGGCVAMQLALDFPGLARALVIVNSAPEFVRRSFRTRVETWRRTAIVHWRGLRAMGERIGRRLLPDPGQEALRAAFVERFAQNDPAAYLHSLKALVGWTVTDQLASIRCPVLVVASEHDYSPVAAKEEYVRRFPSARLVAIPGAHHAVPVECPAAFHAVVAEFLSALDSPGALDYQVAPVSASPGRRKGTEL